MTPLAITVLTFILLLAIRTPVAFSLLGATIVGIWISPTQISFAIVPTAMWQGVNSFVLLAVPFFILMGNLALVSGVTQRLVDAASAWVGHVRGGLAHVSVIVNTIMAGMSGSDLADAAATGGLLIPAMRKAGYPPAYAASIIAGAATIGPLVPPSIAFIIFASASNTSVGRLFLGGAIPGLVLALFLMIQAYFVARRQNYPRTQQATFRQKLRATWISVPVLLIPVWVLGSILYGIATPTEAAVLGVVAVLVIGGLFYRSLRTSDIGKEVVACIQTTAEIFLVIGAASAFARLLALYGAADLITTWTVGLTSEPLFFLLGVNVLFLILGCFIDTIPILLIFVPLLMPTVQQLGIDPIHFGVVTVFNLLIGLVTPPYGLTMFVVCRIAGISIVEFWRFFWPIFLVLVFTLLLVTIFPPFATFLPNLLMPLR